MPKIILDAYTIKARLIPFFITALPLPLTILIWFPMESLPLDALIPFASACGLTMLFSQICRYFTPPGAAERVAGKGIGNCGAIRIDDTKIIC